MPVNTVKEVFEIPEAQLVEAIFAEIPGNPRHVFLTSVLQMKWSMKNQANAEETSQFTKELVNQTTVLATQTTTLANQTRNLAIATWGIAAITLITQIGLIVLALRGGR